MWRYPCCNVVFQEAEERRKVMEASTLEKLAEKEKRAKEVRAKKASLPSSEAEATGKA